MPPFFIDFRKFFIQTARRAPLPLPQSPHHLASHREETYQRVKNEEKEPKISSRVPHHVPYQSSHVAKRDPYGVDDFAVLVPRLGNKIGSRDPERCLRATNMQDGGNSDTFSKLLLSQAMPKSPRMRQLFRNLGLLLLLLVAQHGALVHELGHVTGGAGKVVPSGVLDSTCAQCPAFAQVATPAFSHAFHIFLLVRSAIEPSAVPLFAVIDTAPPQPRSRGPPV